MGWLEDLSKNTTYNYKNIDGDIISGNKSFLESLVGHDLTCEPEDTFTVEGLSYQYAGFKPKELSITTKVVYEKNGRKAVVINHPDGSKSYRSMTRENLLKGKGIKKTGDHINAKGEKTGKKNYEVQSILTKGCQEASNKATMNTVHNRLTSMKETIKYQNHLNKEKSKK